MGMALASLPLWFGSFFNPLHDSIQLHQLPPEISKTQRTFLLKSIRPYSLPTQQTQVLHLGSIFCLTSDSFRIHLELPFWFNPSKSHSGRSISVYAHTAHHVISQSMGFFAPGINLFNQAHSYSDFFFIWYSYDTLNVSSVYIIYLACCAFSIRLFVATFFLFLMFFFFTFLLPVCHQPIFPRLMLSHIYMVPKCAGWRPE